MKFSIIVPVYNGEAYIENSINSILSQKGSFDLELIVIDGRSTDKTTLYLQKIFYLYEMKQLSYGCNSLALNIVSEKDNGMYDAIAKGFKSASGDVVAWLNSDDYYFDGALGKVAQVFENNADELWIVGNCNVEKDNELIYKNVMRPYPNEFIRSGLLGVFSECFIPQESCFWRIKLLEYIDYNIFTSLKLAGDFYLWYIFSKHTTLTLLNDNLAVFRKHNNNMSNDASRYRVEMKYILGSELKYSIREQYWLRDYGINWNNIDENRVIPFTFLSYEDGIYKKNLYTRKREISSPKLTIITICRNCENEIELTCQSILAQSYRDFEWIVVDGASNDGTYERLQKYTDSIDVLISESDDGIYDAMNKGVRLASGEWIVFLNGGDQFHDYSVLDKVSIYFDIQGYDVFYADEERYKNGKCHIYKLPEKIPPYFMCYQAFAHQSMAFRRCLFEKYGMFDVDFKISGDSEFNTRLLEKRVKFKKIPIVMASRVLDGVSEDDNEKLKTERKIRREKYYSSSIVDLYKDGVSEKKVSINIPIINVKEYKKGRIKRYYLFGVIPLLEARRAFEFAK